MRTEVKNRLVMSHALVSARKEVASPDVYGWVWITPLSDGTFKVSTVEVPKHLVDEDICFFEDDIVRTHIGTVADISEAEALVVGVGVDPEDLNVPWHNDFPL
ncbi:hypothetical protein [Actinomadura atramentaria]|uniref:hypothetical protein n=1 Tax=Actinomadura atramentaria TaxID=1990 RepID=UPI0012FA01DB|nr:hypothetical protein [Actinomadura atramentaria]